MNKVVDCIKIHNDILKECKEKVEQYDALGYKKPKLLIIANENDEASKVYIRNKVKACEYVGVNVVTTDKPNTKDFPKYDGILIQLPSTYEHLIHLVDAKQDVDGLTCMNVGRLNLDRVPHHLPCTPKGIMTMLKHERYDLDGKHVVIIGRSNIVGRPLAAMMEQANATVTLCHSHTKDLKSITKMADVLVVAVGKPKFITRDYIKEGAFIIDVGINRDSDGKLCGDVDFDNVYDKCGRITPVPGGVGKLTIASLMQNITSSIEY